jgi:hypothetical protein
MKEGDQIYRKSYLKELAELNKRYGLIVVAHGGSDGGYFLDTIAEDQEIDYAILELGKATEYMGSVNSVAKIFIVSKGK